MKTSSLLFFFLGFVAIAFAQTKSSAVRVLHATARHWVSGAPGGRTGTEYNIKICIATHKKIDFNSLWLGEVNVPMKTEFYMPVKPSTIKKGDTLLITYNHINGESNPDFTPQPLPFKYKGAALITLTVNRKPKYILIEKLKPLPTLQGM